MHTVRWFQVFQCNSLTSDICLHALKWTTSIPPTDRTLPANTNLGQSGPGSNSNKKVLYVAQSSRTGRSILGDLVSYPRLSLWGGVMVLPGCRDAVGVDYSPRRLG